MEIFPALVCPAKWDRLMVCTDGSAEGQNAVAATLQLAIACRSQVQVVQVLVVGDQVVPPSYRAMLAEEIQKNIEVIKVAAAKLQVPIQAVVLEHRTPYAAILSQVEKLHPDLIIMGRRGKTALARLLMGSVTAQVIGHSPIGILVVPLGASVGFQRILVALDGSSYSEAACKLALAMAKEAKSQLISVAVAPRKGSITETKAIIQKMFTAAREAELSLKGVKGISLKEISADTGIVQEAIKNEVDLIIMGSYGRTGLKKLLMGSTTEKVIGNAPCPILIVK